MNVESASVNYAFFFAGLLIAAVLLGITIVQASTFFFVHRKDPRGHKAVITSVLTLDVLHFAFVATSFFSYVVLQPAGEKPDAIHFIWSCKVFYALETVTIAIAHCMYGLRIWRLAKPEDIFVRFIAVSVFVLIAGSFAVGIATSIKVFGLWSLAKGFQPTSTWNFINLGLSSLVDIFVTGLLTYSLYRRTSYSWAQSVNELFIAFALNTGMLTVLFSAAAFIAFASDPSSLIFLAFRMVLMTVHVNSLIGMFNARYYFRVQTPPSTIVIPSHQASINISKHGRARAVPHHHGLRSSTPTINEAGLPLFSRDSLESEGHPTVVEVHVTTTQDKSVTSL
ncbi:hypothetical protein ONZ45_g16369 [Pleurotus djamor]|nr:hypothetical protein ONZ45_g16369 [Pleurotus djamor]